MRKSDKAELRRRGMIEPEDLETISQRSHPQLVQLLSAGTSTERSAAARLLADQVVRKEICCAFLEQLCIEKSLYTKIELCTALEKGNIQTARQMTEYLGKIGTNHHKELPLEVSKKVSYPLPRDIIARTLARMDNTVLPVLLEVLNTGEETRISEVVDAIGFLIFYNPHLSTIQNLNMIKALMDRFRENEVIYWKAVTCLSSFPLPESLDILEEIGSKDRRRVIREEAVRAKKLVIRKTGEIPML
jgi:HEAT repeat protein